MAELFLARDAHTNALVVLKRILPYLSKEAEFLQMFLDEARIAAQLHHPNIIRVHELGKLSDSIFIAMELVEGADLRKVLQEEMKSQKTVPYAIAAYVIARVCAGLHYAHHRVGLDGRPLDVIHRDVSPQNVMVGFNGDVKLVDFGIAKAGALVERSKPGVIKGKFLYLAPEQLSQEVIDHRADLFAVGTMLYEITTGKSPFFRSTTEAVIFAIRSEDPPPPHLVRADYPLALSRIVMKCLVKDRARRYQEASEIQADLDEFSSAEKPTGAPELEAYIGKLLGAEEERTMLHVPALPVPERRAQDEHTASIEAKPTSNERSPAVSKEEEPSTLNARPEDLVRAFDAMVRSYDDQRPAAPVFDASPTDVRARDDVPTREIKSTPPPAAMRDDGLDYELTDQSPGPFSRGRQWVAQKPLGAAALAFAAVLLLGLWAAWALLGETSSSTSPPPTGAEAPTREASPPSTVSKAPPPVLPQKAPAPPDAGPSSELTNSVGRVTVIFRAPARTRIQDASGRERLAPNVRLLLLPGTQQILYRCPSRRGKKSKLLNLAFRAQAPRDGSPQIVRLCR